MYSNRIRSKYEMIFVNLKSLISRTKYAIQTGDLQKHFKIKRFLKFEYLLIDIIKCMKIHEFLTNFDKPPIKLRIQFQLPFREIVQKLVSIYLSTKKKTTPSTRIIESTIKPAHHINKGTTVI